MGDRLSESGYFRAKIAQEKLIKGSPVPYSIVQATQFFEFLKGLADISSDGEQMHLPHVLFQPMAADDVASALGRVAVGPPLNGTVEIGGPEQFRIDDLVRRRLAALKDSREVIPDPKARYSGAKLSEKTLVPGYNARLGETPFETWLSHSAAYAVTPRGTSCISFRCRRGRDHCGRPCCRRGVREPAQPPARRRGSTSAWAVDVR